MPLERELGRRGQMHLFSFLPRFLDPLKLRCLRRPKQRCRRGHDVDGDRGQWSPVEDGKERHSRLSGETGEGLQLMSQVEADEQVAWCRVE